MHSAVYAVVWRQLVSLSVYPSVTFVHCIEASKCMLKLFHLLVD